MRIIVVANASEGGKAAAQIFSQELQNGAKVFGLATGSTPLSTYQELCNSNMDFSDCTSINLDEYVGISASNPQSYAYFMHQNLFAAKPFAHSFIPNGMAKDIEEEISRYNHLIDENNVDLQILGIGQNGHIGFNEPGTSFDSLTHKVALTESTINANSRFFSDINDVPKEALTMGLKSICKAKHILLIAYGKIKADAIDKMINGPVSEELPASILRNHSNVTVIVDEEAASGLKTVRWPECKQWLKMLIFMLAMA